MATTNFLSKQKPTKEERRVAKESLDTIKATLSELDSAFPEIEIEETHEKIRLPINALRLLVQILEETSKGNPISIVPIAAEMTTQAAAEMLGVSRPHVVKLLEEGEIPFTKVGRHRRIKYEDVRDYKMKMKKKQREALIQIIQSDEEAGLYDT